MIELKVHDRVRIIDSSQEREYSLYQTGRVISIADVAGDNDVIIRLDKNGATGGFMQLINFDSHHTRNQLEKLSNK